MVVILLSFRVKSHYYLSYPEMAGENIMHTFASNQMSGNELKFTYHQENHLEAERRNCVMPVENRTLGTHTSHMKKFQSSVFYLTCID